MAESAVVTVRLAANVKQRLDKLARATRRSKSFLAAEAIERYVADEAEFLAAVEEGVAQADAGQVVSHDRVSAWVHSWGTDTETPKPDPE